MISYLSHAIVVLIVSVSDFAFQLICVWDDSGGASGLLCKDVFGSKPDSGLAKETSGLAHVP